MPAGALHPVRRPGALPPTSPALRAALRARSALSATALVAVAAGLAACAPAPSEAPPPLRPGTPDAPREVNIIAKDYEFLPPVLELVAGETVLLHVINGGLEVHEAVIGDQAVQDAWEAAEVATVGAPPGPTPLVSVPPAVAGLRIVVRSGERQNVLYTVPVAETPLIVGCHIPGHYAKGMLAPVRLVQPAARGEPRVIPS